VSAAHLRAEGLGPAFVQYMRSPFWKGFVEPEEADREPASGAKTA
jgi:hypothetical protein